VLGEEQAIEALKQGATDYVLKQRLGRWCLRLSAPCGKAENGSSDSR